MKASLQLQPMYCSRDYNYSSRTKFEQFPLWEGMVILNELNFKFPLWEGVMVLKEVIFNSFLFWEGVMVLKDISFNSFYFGRVWWS